jgi:hypothetical protein
MSACCKECSSKHRAIIRNSIYFFSDNNLINAKPVPEEDRYEYALRVALVTYSIAVGIKKSQEK